MTHIFIINVSDVIHHHISHLQELSTMETSSIHVINALEYWCHMVPLWHLKSGVLSAPPVTQAV